MTDQATTGLDPHLYEATADDALAALDRAGAAATRLVEEWVKRGNAAAVARVADEGTGAPRKAARRGLNVLKARRIAVPERTRVAKVGTTAEEAVDQAYMLAPDTSGSSLFVFTRRSSTSRCRAAFVILNDAFGVQRVDNDELSQSKLDERLERAITNGAYKPVAVPLDWARWRVARALSRHAARGIPEPLGLTTAKELLQPAPTTAPAHPLDDEGLVLDDEDARDVARRSAKLHELPEFQGWFPPKRAVDEMMLRVGQTLKQGEEPPAGHVERELEEQVKAATDRYFTPEMRERVLELMRDSTLSVLSRAGEQVALEVIAAMKAIESCGLITDPPHDVPFLRGFFDKAIALMVAQGQGSLKIPVPNRLPMDGLPEGEAEPRSTEEPAGAATGPSSADEPAAAADSAADGASGPEPATGGGSAQDEPGSPEPAP